MILLTAIFLFGCPMFVLVCIVFTVSNIAFCFYLLLLLIVSRMLCLRRQWVREEDLAKDLKLHSKQLRRTLRFFEEEKVVTRDHRREVCHDCSPHVL